MSRLASHWSVSRAAVGTAFLLLVGLPACTPAAFGVNEAAVDQARSAGIPLVVDSVEIFRGDSNDTYVRMEFTAVGDQPIVGLVVRAQLRDAGGNPLSNRPSGDSSLELRLEAGFDFRHAGIWGPYFVGPYARCLSVDSVDLLLESGRRILVGRGDELGTALKYTQGDLCR
jgi:hypothetical protein